MSAPEINWMNGDVEAQLEAAQSYSPPPSLVSTAAATYAVQLTDRIIIANNTGGSQNIVLPVWGVTVGQTFCIKCALATPPVIVSCADGVTTIDGGTSVDLWNVPANTSGVTTTFGSSLTAAWDGTQYWVVEGT